LRLENVFLILRFYAPFVKVIPAQAIFVIPAQAIFVIPA